MKIIAVLLLSVALSGCALERAYQTLSDLSISPQLIIVAGNSFDAVEVTAKNVIVACTPTARPAACTSIDFTSLIGAVRAGRQARDALEAFIKAHPGQLGSQGLYDALVSTTSTISKAVTAYGATP